MPIVVDTENVVSSEETAPDGLRAEIGSYYSPQSRRALRRQSPSNFVNFNVNIGKRIINNLPTNDQVLIPTKKATILFTGKEQSFRDQTQWNEYVQSIVSDGSTFLDHQFVLDAPTIENSFHKNYHNPVYEDFTKTFNSNQLLNYNLISYPFKGASETVSKLGDIKTNFDEASNFSIQNRQTLLTAMEQFSNRIVNYSGTPNEISVKQRNIFDLQQPERADLPRVDLGFGPRTGFSRSFTVEGTEPLMPPSAFPYHYEKTLPAMGTNSGIQELKQAMDGYGKTKNIFQAIKRDLSFFNRSFTVGTEEIQAKLYDFISIITSTDIVSIKEQNDEVFLVPEGEIGFGESHKRFVENVSAVRFLSDTRRFINNHSRNLEQVFNAQSCKTFFLGYKIEKYLDNDAGQPIQTYYTNDAKFIDTQLKYGRRYIYKTKILLGVLGSSYTYSNLNISQNETEMYNQQGQKAQILPSQFAEISSEKYRAYVDVSIVPSFKILEHQVDEDTVAFMDSPTLPPQVELYSRKDKGTLQMRFSPNFFKVESVSSESSREVLRSLNPVTEEDKRIAALLSISKNSFVEPDYFTGIYEIYRTTKPPQTEKDFANSLLATIDDRTGYAFPKEMNLPEVQLDNMNGYFEDSVAVNQKYYYVFRALTYHGTPSNMTIPYEVEVLRDSDEFKVNISEYKYPKEKGFVFSKKAKRIIKITPNIERLLFSQEEGRTMWKLDDGELLELGITRTFKIRVTSKHTGKKMDLNINFKLSQDDSFYDNKVP